MEAIVAEAPIKPLADAEGLSLSRWSRLKREQRAAVSSQARESAEKSALEHEIAPVSATQSSTGEAGVEALPPLSSISLTEDFTPFMQAKVPQLLKQQALKALFKDPHFNAMDGLDIYIDDYTVFEPISAEDMGKLSAWKSIQNPLKQVVTPGGYAVDVESEEGIAVLAEQARTEALGAETSRDALTDSASSLNELETNGALEESLTLEPESAPYTVVEGSQTAIPITPVNPAHVSVATHSRYGKRVGDFSFVEAKPEIQDVERNVAPDIPDKTTIETPR
jgi:hypothetical protein